MIVAQLRYAFDVVVEGWIITNIAKNANYLQTLMLVSTNKIVQLPDVALSNCKICCREAVTSANIFSGFS
jgi:hypothetical protein